MKQTRSLSKFSWLSEFTRLYPNSVTFCMLGIFSYFCCRLLNFFKINFFKKIFQEHYQIQNLMSKHLNPDQDRHFVCPDLDPNCMQRLSVEDKRCRQLLLNSTMSIVGPLKNIIALVTRSQPVKTYVICSSHLLMFIGSLYCLGAVWS